MSRTPNYVMTVDVKDGKTDDEVLNLVRMLVRLGNKYSGTKKYVKLHGRGSRLGVAKYHQSLPLPFATSADVYIYDR